MQGTQGGNLKTKQGREGVHKKAIEERRGTQGRVRRLEVTRGGAGSGSGEGIESIRLSERGHKARRRVWIGDDTGGSPGGETAQERTREA
jgi:hypothetical protein